MMNKKKVYSKIITRYKIESIKSSCFIQTKKCSSNFFYKKGTVNFLGLTFQKPSYNKQPLSPLNITNFQS
jgi:hypothetical protein